MSEEAGSRNAPQLPPRAQLLKMLTASWISQATYAAAKLGLVDLMARSAQSPGQLAEATGADANVLYRLLRALASVGLFAEDETGRFAPTPLGDCLRSDRPDSVQPLAIMMGEELYQAWGGFLHSVQTGRPAFDHVFEMSFFEYLQKTPHAGALFDACMATIHGAESEAVVAAYDFAPCRTVVDVGGGAGSLLTAILQAHPDLEGVLFDLPEVIQRAQKDMEEAGLRQRCKLVPGSFFASLPSGGDTYLLRHIIHDWDDEEAGRILENCRKVMPDAARLLIVESVIPPGNEPFVGKILDLNMLVLSGGQERTLAQFEDLLQKAGFKLSKVLPTSVMRLSIIEAAPR